MSVQVFCPFFNWVVGFFAVELYKLFVILEIKPLSVASFETIFSHSVVCLFLFFFVFPLYIKGVRLSLHVYIAITVFPPPFLLLQHEYLDIVLNAVQQDLLVNLF